MLKLNKCTLDDLDELYEDLEYINNHRVPQITDENVTLDRRKNAVFFCYQQIYNYCLHQLRP